VTGGTKLCLQNTGSKECVKHSPGYQVVKDNTLYICAATSSIFLTTVFKDPTLSVAGMEKDLAEHIAQAEGGKGHCQRLFSFLKLKDNNLTTTDGYTVTVELQEGSNIFPLKTPTKLRSEEEVKELGLDVSAPDVKAMYLTMGLPGKMPTSITRNWVALKALLRVSKSMGRGGVPRKGCIRLSRSLENK